MAELVDAQVSEACGLKLVMVRFHSSAFFYFQKALAILTKMIAQKDKQRAPRNRTIQLTPQEIETYRSRIVYSQNNLKNFQNKIICGDTFEVLRFLPKNSFDLLFADPPYNLTKNFGENSFRQISVEEYETWLDSWLKKIARLLKPTAQFIFAAIGVLRARFSASERSISLFAIE